MLYLMVFLMELESLAIGVEADYTAFQKLLSLETVVACYPGREVWSGRDAPFLVSREYN